MRLMTPTCNLFDSEKEGAVYGMPEQEYRQERALSTSELKLMKNPSEFYKQVTGRLRRESTPSMELGTMFHSYILEPDMFHQTYAVCPDECSDGRTKEGRAWRAKVKELGQKPISEAQQRQLKNMEDSIQQEEAWQFIEDDPVTELSVFSQNAWPYPSKCRIDCYHPNSETVVDIKTCAPGKASKRGFFYSVRDYQYALQQWNYIHLMREQGLPVKRWIWLFIETGGYYSAASWMLSKESMVRAGQTVHEYMTKLTHCLDEDHWPSYTSEGIQTVDVF